MTPRSAAALAALAAVSLYAHDHEHSEKFMPHLEPVLPQPTFEVSLDLCSRQLTYGLADNRDPILTADGVVAWGDFSLEVTAIADTTGWGERHGGYGDRAGNYQEFAFGPGCTRLLAPEECSLLPTVLELGARYVYEYHPAVNRHKGEANPDTQFVYLTAALPKLWLAPALSAEFDIDNESGAIYLGAEVSHTFALVSAAGDRATAPLALSLGAGVGFGNPKRNTYDAALDAYGFKDVWVSAALEWQIMDNVVLSPYIAVYEQLQGRLREAARTAVEGEQHASTQAIGGLRCSAGF